MTDTSIVQILLKLNFRDIYEELEESGGSLYLNNAVNKWLLSLFVQGISEMYTYFIWDMFLLEGNIIIFKTIYAMIIILESHIIKCKTFDQLNSVFNDVPMTLNKRGKLAYYLISKKFNFNMDMIKKYRKTLSLSIIKEIMNIGTFGNDKSEEEEEENDELGNDKKLTCDLDWPMCLNDKKMLEKEYDHVVLKQLDEPLIIDNYIDNLEEYENLGKNDKKEDEEEFFKEKIFKELLIERKKHYCDSKQMTIRDNLPKTQINNKRLKSVDIRTRKISADYYKNDNNDAISLERNKTINKIIKDIANDNKDKISFVKENVEKGLLKDD